MSNNTPKVFTTLILLSLFSNGSGLCSKDEFKCDTTKCVIILFRCDGEMNCDDYSDELHCDVKGTKQNTRNLTTPANITSPPTPPTTLTASPTTPPTSFHKRTKFIPPKNRKQNGFKRKRVYFDNHTKRRKNHPSYHKKTPARSQQDEPSTAASEKTTSEVKTKAKESPVTHCSVKECVRWKVCWRDVKRSHKCECDEVACERDWKVSAHAGNENDKGMKDVFEWAVISTSSTCLIVAIIVLLLKRRRLRQNNIRPLHVRTVICYHHEQADSACPSRSAKCRPLCDKAGCSSLVDQDEGKVLYIDLNGEAWQMS